MVQLQNPFTTLYVTERLKEDEFPSLFSPVLLPHVLALFQDGNVVVRGTQGTGKSMLLALLRTDIRIAFEASKHPYPVDGELVHFVSAGINLATNQALRFGHRWRTDASPTAQGELQDSFVDYVNAWILRDLLQSINSLQNSKSGIWVKYGLGGQTPLDEGIKQLGQDSLVGALLAMPHTFEQACDQLTARIETYLRFLNGKISQLPTNVKERQSQGIGRPISTAVQVLRDLGCLRNSTRILVTIDQFEHLLDYEMELQNRHFNLLRNLVDEAIHLREPTICYRIGTRPHAWRQKRSERLRDYADLDLDDLLRRKEHSKRPLFPVFAEDVFRRRMNKFGYGDITSARDSIKQVFGNSPSPSQRIQRLASNSKWPRLLRIPSSFPQSIQQSLKDLAKDDPLSAKLGIAWIHQQLAAGEAKTNISNLTLDPNDLPWEAEAKKWWKKERIGIAVLQMAAGCGQRMPMFGKQDVIGLAGSNILVFGSICQQIWACWIRSLNGENSAPSKTIDSSSQEEGIRTASEEWHAKISEEPWLGDDLTQFIDTLGNYLHKSLIDDKPMSYPGGNGISLSAKDLRTFPEVQQILRHGTDRGFLLQRRHTPKYRSRGPSKKWYLHPVLAPYFELTVGHTKEPLYLSADVLSRWLSELGISVPPNVAASQKITDQRQINLPGFED